MNLTPDPAVRPARSVWIATVGALVAACVVASPAFAAPPTNDNRADARDLGTLPARVMGTTVGATVEGDGAEPRVNCADGRESVWYRLSETSTKRIVVNLTAQGDLDAAVDVFRSERSRVSPIDCDVVDRRGRASLSFTAGKGEDYLIRVSQLRASKPGKFDLEAFSPKPAAKPPGRRLPRGGVVGTVDRVVEPSEAYSMTMRSGVTYKVNLATGGRCMRLALYAPGTRSFGDAAPVRSRGCGGYLVFTPGPDEGGRYSMLVSASGGTRGAQRYRLIAGRAGADDTAPGISLGNYAPRRGGLRGSRVDVVDLYRFDIERRSKLDLRLRTGGDFDLELLNEGGRRIACGCGESGNTEVRRGLRPGRYFAVVRARGGSSGRYRLTRVSREISFTRADINGTRRAQVDAGATVRIGATVRPAASGRVTILVSRFDPLEGWQFLRRYRTRAAGGRASVSFRPLGPGSYRARVRFEGSRTASLSDSGFAYVRVR